MHALCYNLGLGLNLYKVLAPNAYPQLDGNVVITDSRVLSQVYDVSHSLPISIIHARALKLELDLGCLY